MKALWRNLLIGFVVALILFLGLNFTAERAVVDGSSMLPTLENRQQLIILTAIYHFTSPQRGDVIVVRPPIAPQSLWVKRLIGLPGDTIEIRNGVVYVNSIALEEPYIQAAPEYSLSLFTVPADQYFVLGDNRNHSSDSHYGWTVARADIVGKAWLRYWPFSQWGFVPTYNLAAGMPETNGTPTGASVP
jgi:signal peptidase I